MEREDLTRAIIGAAMEVHRTLGPGFVESVYGHALLHELILCGLSTTSELEVQIRYKGVIVGRHRLDLVVENQVIVELKAAHSIAEVHLSQALSYMKATSLAVCLIVNFGERSLTWKRLVKSRF